MTTTEQPTGAIGDTRLNGGGALVTGAAGNVGSDMIGALAAAGADVAIAYHSGREAAEQLVASVRANGRRAIALPADLRDAGAAERLVDSVTDNLGAVDILVANAGAGAARSWEQVGAVEFDDALAGKPPGPDFVGPRRLPPVIHPVLGRKIFL